MRYFAALLCIAIVALSPGCASTADKTALNVEIGSRTSLTLAWNTFRSLRAKQKISDNEWKTGAAAMENYKQASRLFLNVLEVYQKNKDTLPSLDQALALVSSTWSQLYPILVKYYPALTKTPPPL